MNLFHGTTHNFNSFDVERAFDKNHVGQAVYLTTCFDDARINYAGLGPDLSARIDYLAEDLENELESDNGASYGSDKYRERYNKCHEIAEKKLNGGNKFLLTCEIDESANLFLIGDNYYDLYTYDEDEEESIDSPLLESLCYYLSEDELELIITDCEMKSIDIIRNILRHCEDDPEQNGQLIRKILLRAGYDGIEYQDAHQFFPYMVEKGTQHFAIYKSELVKIVDREEV